MSVAPAPRRAHGAHRPHRHRHRAHLARQPVRHRAAWGVGRPRPPQAPARPVPPRPRRAAASTTASSARRSTLDTAGFAPSPGPRSTSSPGRRSPRRPGTPSPPTCRSSASRTAPRGWPRRSPPSRAPSPRRCRLHYLSCRRRRRWRWWRCWPRPTSSTGARIIMEKPFGTDLPSARRLNAALHETFDEAQIFRIDHFLGKEAALNILAFRFANGLFEPIWNREHIDHIQIDVPETLSLGTRTAFYERTGAYRDMVVTHLLQILAFVAMEPPTALEPRAITEEKNKVFRSMLPIQPADVVRGQYTGYLDEPGVAPHSETETFIALRCLIDNWRWAGVPFFLRTGKRLAEGARIISIAFREPPRSMFPAGSGVGAHGPDHLTFDLADASKLSLSFYGKRPGPGMRLDKLSLQFEISETSDVLEAYERLIHDAMCGDHTLFTTSDGIEQLWSGRCPCSPTRHRCGRMPLGRGAPTPSTSSSPRMPGACPSNARGARCRSGGAGSSGRPGRSVLVVGSGSPAEWFVQ
ncbi:MAG: hypothetical protein R2699_05740 [Acidimicrobiales bacterium]